MGEEISKIFNKITASISFVCATLTSTFGIEWVLFLGYLILNIIDYITGTIKARTNKSESSSKGLNGIIGVSFLVSFLLVQLGNKININLEFIMLFGWFTLACLIVNETRSIIENFVEIGINVPSFLKKGLEVYENILKNAIEKFNNNDKAN